MEFRYLAARLQNSAGCFSLWKNYVFDSREMATKKPMRSMYIHIYICVCIYIYLYMITTLLRGGRTQIAKYNLHVFEGGAW